MKTFNRTTFLKHNKTLFIGIGVALSLKTLSYFSLFVEKIYTPYIFSLFTKLLRFLFGWLPFSFGDIVYVLLGLFIIYKVIKAIALFRKKQLTLRKLGYSILGKVLWLYVFFMLIWGLQYNRKGIAWQLKIDTAQKVDSTDVKKILLECIDSLNALAPLVTDSGTFLLHNIKPSLINSYALATEKYPYLAYDHLSLKPSLFGSLLGNMGFMGYYNPLSGEAQIKANLPNFMHPIVCLHEMAHQIGYAKEDEANMVGFVVAAESSNPYIKYSYYFDLFQYTKMELRQFDSIALKAIVQQLHPQVKKDFATWRNYLRRSTNTFLHNASQSFYNSYLKLNSSHKGLASYNDVVRLMVLYNNKYKDVPN